MGVCFSKKKASSSHHNSPPPPPPQPQPAALPVSSAVAPPSVAETSLNNNTLKAGSGPKVAAEEAQVGNASQGEDSFVKKEIFVIKHRKSHDRQRPSSPPPQPQGAPHSAEDDSASSASTEGGICNISTAVRTSSCTKEEVDAILIQCGRLSRSNSAGKTPSSSRKYSGSKRSYDFDNDNDIGVATNDYGLRKKGNDGICDDYRPRRRQSSRSSSSQGQERRRTPSREREQRSGSRERCSSGGGRRVSRSPGRRSENTQAQGSNVANNTTSRPGKMVSVPATVSSMAMDKSGNGGEAATTTNANANAVKRITVKRNVGVGEAAVGVISSRTTASPRSQSPARTNPNANGNGNNAKGGCNENQQQPVLSRSSSRKAEHSPYRRNPLSEIDPNSLAYPPSAATANKNSNKGQGGIKESTNAINQKSNVQGPNQKVGNGIAMVEEVKTLPTKAGAEILNPQSQAQTLTRSRSSRQSRDLDLNPETLLNPIPLSYTTLLLEDIQNFHQTNNNNPPSSFSLPPSVSKACSILEAVADLNSTTSSNLSSAFSENRKGLSAGDSNKNGYNNIGVGRKMGETRDPFVESEVVGSDDLMEPSFHKYVTVRRGGADMDEQESSGSNSFVGSGQQQQHWGLSSSSWEPNSADSTDRYTSRTRSREDDCSGPMGLQRHASGLAESGSDMKNSARKGLSGRRDTDHQCAGAKIGAGKGLHSIPFAAPAST